MLNSGKEANRRMAKFAFDEGIWKSFFSLFFAPCSVVNVLAFIHSKAVWKIKPKSSNSSKIDVCNKKNQKCQDLNSCLISSWTNIYLYFKGSSSNMNSQKVFVIQ